MPFVQDLPLGTLHLIEMECLGRCAPTGSWWIARSWTSARKRPATASRHREGVRDPLFQHPNPIPQLGRELEVLALDGPPQLRLQVEQPVARIVTDLRTAPPSFARQLVALPHVLARAVQPPQQITQVCVEGYIASIAAEAAGVAEIAQGAAAGRAPQCIAGRGDERACSTAPLHHCTEKIAQRTLQHRATGFDALLLGALLAQVERDFGVVLDLGQVDDGVAFLTVIAQHQGIASTELTVVSRPSSSNRTRSAPPASSAGRWLIRPASPTSDSTSSARERALRGVAPPISRGIMTFSNAENSRSK